MRRVATVATCTLNQWAMDFQGNMERIIESVERARAAGARYRCGPELDVTGYSCGDHYHESDTLQGAWEVVSQIMQHPACADIMMDIGLPVSHKNVIYNCKLVFFNKRILLIRPKMIVANNFNMGSREGRWFTPWRKVREVEEHLLPPCVTSVAGQTSVLFGDAVIATRDTTIGYEMCVELWNPESPHVAMSLDGVEIICNGSGALQELGAADDTYSCVRRATAKTGGCYLFANQRGCDGSSGYFAGDAYIGMNGEIVGCAAGYSLAQVEVVTATLDLETVRRYRSLFRSRCEQAAASPTYPRVQVDFSLCSEVAYLPSCDPVVPWVPSVAQQVVEGPACWLWDYLRRSGRKGLLLSLAGDVDSSATAAIVSCMCHKIVDAVAAGDKEVVCEIQRITEDGEYVPSDPRELCGRLLYTLHLPSPPPATHSANQMCLPPSAAHLAHQLAKEIGSKYQSVAVEGGVSAIMESFTAASGSCPRHQHQGGSPVEEEAFDHLHSRLRMTMAYLFAQLGLWSQGQTGELLVLASSSADNIMAGSWAKYGDTSADVNLLARFPKKEIEKALLLWAKDKLNLPVLKDIVDSRARESEGKTLTEEEMAVMRNLQAMEYCGPYSMFSRLMYLWRNTCSLKQMGEKTKAFFRWSSQQRHKMTALATPYYVPGTGPPDIDRPLFYNHTWSWQFTAIDRAVEQLNSEKK
ncbi:glutamine-dependent NAD(+) synthetase [Procambarus clarkii]|uniref:glutamine-dependent NAD(+) synthetase n=1 Tax=Procambarus clarkii TaxID=6728 RepID=UPI003742A835